MRQDALEQGPDLQPAEKEMITNAKGYRSPNGWRIAITFFDRELFDSIKARAEKNKKSMSATIVDLAKLGLFDIEESEKHEPKRV